MKLNKVLLIVIVLALILVLMWAYKRYLYFPHAKVIDVRADQLSWTNGDLIEKSTVYITGSAATGGSYSNNFDYRIEKLPNKQFRFIVFKKGHPTDIRVDNIISFDHPPFYLTK